MMKNLLENRSIFYWHLPAHLKSSWLYYSSLRIFYDIIHRFLFREDLHYTRQSFYLLLPVEYIDLDWNKVYQKCSHHPSFHCWFHRKNEYTRDMKDARAHE